MNSNYYSFDKDRNNVPIISSQNIRIEPLGPCNHGYSSHGIRSRRYTKAEYIEDLAVKKYKEYGKGITFRELLSNGLTSHKGQAQTTLKYCLRKNTLFTLHNNKPQRYYPSCLKAEISKKNIPIGVTGVDYSKSGLLQSIPTTGSSESLDPVIVQTFEGYVLPLLPEASLHIHRMQFKVKIPAEYYHEIALPAVPLNKGKEHEEIIGSAHVSYCFYANGGDDNWWLGTHGTNNQLNWTHADNTIGFGHGARYGPGTDRPTWVSKFTRTDRVQILFYFAGNDNWHLGTYNEAKPIGDRIDWMTVGNTAGFGRRAMIDGRPIWTGDFNGDGKIDILFYFPGDDN